MAYAHEGFDPSKQSYEFSFKILNIGCDVWVGVGNDEEMKVVSYNLNNSELLGHGQYMLSPYSNYTFHHTDEKLNCQ